MSSRARDAHDNPAAAPAATGAPLELTHAQMNAAYDKGLAVPFAQAIPWLIRYQNAWWVVYEGGWLRVTDQPTTENLDQRAAQMTDADVQAARDAAIRAAVASQTAPAPNTDGTAPNRAAAQLTANPTYEE
jgi:hypothetical protein